MGSAGWGGARLGDVFGRSVRTRIFAPLYTIYCSKGRECYTAFLHRIGHQPERFGYHGNIDRPGWKYYYPAYLPGRVSGHMDG